MDRVAIYAHQAHSYSKLSKLESEITFKVKMSETQPILFALPVTQ